MSKLRELKQQILEEGSDLQIDQADWGRIRELLPESGSPSSEDVRVLAEMRTEARSVCRDFDAYFFPAFKSELLADGQISSLERFQLLRMLYSGGGIDPAERTFLQDLKRGLTSTSPEFDALYQQAMQD